MKLPALQRPIVGVVWLALLTTCLQPKGARCDEKTDIDRIIATGLQGSQVMEHLDYLVNRIGPRLTGSDGLQTACEWARDQFASYGLESKLELWGEVPVGFNRGPWTGRVISPEARELEFGTPAWGSGTRGVTRGRAVLAPTNEEQLSLVRDQLPGAWIIDAGRSTGPAGPRPGAPARTQGQRDGEAGGQGSAAPAAGDQPSGAQGNTGAATFRQKLESAYKEAKIAGVVRPTRNELILTSGNSRISWDNLPSTPSINLVKKQFDEIVGWLKDGKSVELEFDIRNYFRKGPIKLYNVIADIRGTDWPDEYVIAGGHIDSWDGATGATDNGTGCATAIEAARVLTRAGVRPRRTIRFMLWSGEEQGLLGSRAYVRAHPELMPKISAVLVHDGGTNYLSAISATEAMLADMEHVFAPVKNMNEKMPFAIRKVDGLRGGGSDHASFLQVGVPGFFWGQAGRASYQRTHHTQFDTYDAAVPEYQEHSAIVVALGAFGLANLDHLLSREKMTTAGGAGPRRTLGVQLDELTITEVAPDSVAQKAGLLTGDIIVSIDGSKLTDRQAFNRALQTGDVKKRIVVLRQGNEIELVAEWPAREE